MLAKTELLDKTTTAPAKAHPSGKTPPRKLELDGLRGIAILFVLVFHYYDLVQPISAGRLSVLFWNVAGLGWSGVDLFFVLSGCLITGILLETKDSAHYFKFFYMRRVLRIMPLYYSAVFFFFWIYMPLVHAAVQKGHLDAIGAPWAGTSEWEQVWYWLHISNWRSGFGYLEDSPVTHFWSLAIEEQFYLLWPWVIRVNRVERLLKICVAGVVTSLLLRNVPYFLHMQTIHGGFMYRLTPFRMDGLLLGSCIPLLARMPKTKELVKQWIWPVVAAASAGLVAICFYVGNDNSTLPMARFGYSAVALICFSLVFQAVEWAGSPRPYAALLRARWLRRIGEISYGIYIIHYMIAYPLAGIWRRFLPKTGFEFADRMLVIGLSAAVAYTLASISWRLLEQPFLRLKRYFA